MIGKTGAGKTTFINMLVNLLLELKYDEERIIAITQAVSLDSENPGGEKRELTCNLSCFKDRQSDKLGNQSESQTRIPNVYTIETATAIFTIVDTPGLGDVGGTLKDKEHVKNIVLGVQSLTEINAILYVHRSTDLKKDLFLQYYISELKGMLTEDCKDNFVVCLTSVVNPGRVQDCLKTLTQVGIDTKRYICFENDCLIPLKMYRFPNDTDGKQRASLKEMSEFFWRANLKSTAELVHMLDNMNFVKTDQLLELFVERQAVVAIVLALGRNLKKNTKLKVKIAQKENEARDEEKKLKAIKPEDLNITMPVTRVVKKQEEREIEKPEDVGYHSTYCNSCLNVCHDHCGLEVLDKGSINFQRCAAFAREEKCKKCPGKCGVDVHAHTTTQLRKVKILVDVDALETTMETVENKDQKAIKDQMELNFEQYRKHIGKLQAEQKDLEDEMARGLKQICYLHKRIESRSMCALNDYTKDYLERQIEVAGANKDLTETQAEQLKAELKRQLANYNEQREALKKAQAAGANLAPAEIKQVEARVSGVKDQLLQDNQSARSLAHMPVASPHPIGSQQGTGIYSQIKAAACSFFKDVRFS